MTKEASPETIVERWCEEVNLVWRDDDAFYDDDEQVGKMSRNRSTPMEIMELKGEPYGLKDDKLYLDTADGMYVVGRDRVGDLANRKVDDERF